MSTANQNIIKKLKYYRRRAERAEFSLRNIRNSYENSLNTANERVILEWRKGCAIGSMIGSLVSLIVLVILLIIFPVYIG